MCFRAVAAAKIRTFLLRDVTILFTNTYSRHVNIVLQNVKILVLQSVACVNIYFTQKIDNQIHAENGVVKRCKCCHIFLQQHTPIFDAYKEEKTIIKSAGCHTVERARTNALPPP